MSLPVAGSGGRFDSGRDYFDFNTLRDHLSKDGVLCVRTIIHATYIPKYIPKGIQYNSKTATGMVGLENLGATCYLNALLQVYFYKDNSISLVISL